MHERPSVSVIMPVRDGAKFLREAIESIRGQTFHKWELIVLDDGSIDASAEIAAAANAADQRVRVVRLGRIGLASALNRGIAEARAPWIARMDADDVSLPERLERQLAFLSTNPDVAAIGTFGWMIGETGRVVGVSEVGPTDAGKFTALRDRSLIYLLTPSVVFSRTAAVSLGGFRADYSPGEDVDLWTRLAEDHLVLVLPEHLLRYRVHATSQSTDQLIAIKQNLERAWINTLRRRAGQPELSGDDWAEIERQRPFALRVKRRLEWSSQAWYRRGASLAAAGRPSGLVWLAIASVVWPPVVIKRIRRQRVLQTLIARMRDVRT